MKYRTILIICEHIPETIIDGVSNAILSFVDLLDPIFHVYIKSDSEESIYKLRGGFGERKKIKLESHINVDFDSIMFTPVNTAFNALSKSLSIGSTRKIALLSDCYTYVLWRQFCVLNKIRDLRIKDLVLLAKIPIYFLRERKIARKSSLVILQTNKDVEVFTKLFRCKNKVVAIPNVLNLPEIDQQDLINCERHGVGFVASFVGSYKRVALWFIKNVWLKVLSFNANQKLYLLGKNNQNFKLEVINTFPELKNSIISSNYINDLSSFYLKRDFVVSPIFKGYGLINKTVEAMYYGCLVIGDESAFNGIPKLKHSRITANTAEEFVSKILNVNFPNVNLMRINAHKCINKSFGREVIQKKVLEIF